MSKFSGFIRASWSYMYDTIHYVMLEFKDLKIVRRYLSQTYDIRNEKKVKVKVKIFIAMQPAKVEMIQDNYTTLQNTK